ncbi:MAG: hypothetical protein M1436_02240, partial [Acidobacteria bacterium]|nr:hypothetical protein [Acidobacteriota bacterium]
MARFSLRLLGVLAALALCGIASGQSISIVSGNGQLSCPLCLPNASPFFDNLVVLVKDAAGKPAANVPVTFTVNGTGTVDYTSSTTKNTGADGTATVSFQQPVTYGISFGVAYQQSTVTATAQGASVVFYETTGLTDQSTGIAQVSSPQLISPVAGTLLSGRAGQPSTTPVQVKVSSLFGVGIPNVELKLVPVTATGTTDANAPSISCQAATGSSGTSVLTDTGGTATCTPVFGGRIGTGQFNIQIGGHFATFGPFNFEVTPGLPCALRILNNSDKQTANVGQMLPGPLVAQVEDCGGNTLPNVAVNWAVTQGTATFVNRRDTSDVNGRVSTNLTVGGAGGPLQVTLSVPAGQTATGQAVSVQFNFTVAVTVTELQKLSGDNQSAIVNQAFGQPLTVQVNNGAQPVPNVAVNFAVTSGSVTLSAASGTTDAQGRASVNATAGANTGAAVVTASIGTFSTAFNLTVAPPGPQNVRFLNGAGFQPNFISPCSVATLTGTGLAPGIQGSVVPAMPFGPLPLLLGGVTVQFGNSYAPLYSVNNLNGQESLSVEVPCELQPGNVQVTVRVGTGSGTFTAPVQAVAPGIFETSANMSDNRRRAILLKPDGTFVTLENPARKGEIIRVYVTGIGR